MALRIFMFGSHLCTNFIGSHFCTNLSIDLVIHLFDLSHVVQHCPIISVFGRACIHCVATATTSDALWTLCSIVYKSFPTLFSYLAERHSNLWWILLSWLLVLIPFFQQVVPVLQGLWILVSPAEIFPIKVTYLSRPTFIMSCIPRMLCLPATIYCVISLGPRSSTLSFCSLHIF